MKWFYCVGALLSPLLSCIACLMCSVQERLKFAGLFMKTCELHHPCIKWSSLGYCPLP
jgi:hypothetical protein